MVRSDISRSIRRLSFLSAVIVSFFTGQATGAEFPVGPIRLVVPFPPGGPNDTLARFTSKAAGNYLDTPFVVDNRAGAGGALGTQIVKDAKPTGYTILMGTAGTHAIGPNLKPNLPYDPIADFAPVIGLASVPYFLVVATSSPAHGLDAFLKLAKNRPGSLNYGSTGIGTVPHLGMEMLKSAANINIVHVPYGGQPQIMNALLAKQIDVSAVPMMAALPLIEAGKLRALAITSATRNAAVPGVPTVAESGFPGYRVTTWFGLFAPARTPTHAIDRLNSAFNSAVNKAEVKTAIVALGAEPMGGTPKEFGEFVKAEIKRWASIVKSSGIKPE